ncbi:hypothetical protein GQ607_004369 [Colletotrichum asianum]|uniref:Uncharacterized protein n=1 Tax=Colletotrichum asianum TaxID=702518 RepID=A0A8H3WIC0_9PEZI|nr:hypothetical protein GQ607_004369 [Colletotrichum asianum]
MGAWCHQTAY